MKTSPAKDADTLRFTLCDDHDMGDMDADPCWWSADVVKPTMKPPCVEPNRLGDTSRVRHPKWTLCGDQPTESHESEVPRPLCCFNRFTARLASERSFTTARDTAPCRVEAVPASSSRHCRAIQDVRLLLPRTLPRSCPNIVPVVKKLVEVFLG